MVVLDVKLPDADGLELLPLLKKRWPDTEVIVLTGYDDVSMAVEAGKRGAYNFVTKFLLRGTSKKLLTDASLQAFERKEQTAENGNLRRRAGDHRAAQRLRQFSRVRPIMRDLGAHGGCASIAPSDVTRFSLPGESGTGKEMSSPTWCIPSVRAARAGSSKLTAPRCLASSSRAELFGSVKGAFLRARTAIGEGLFRQAEAGTLFLDGKFPKMPDHDTQKQVAAGFTGTRRFGR